jgi:hypothetical protein
MARCWPLNRHPNKLGSGYGLQGNCIHPSLSLSLILNRMATEQLQLQLVKLLRALGCLTARSSTCCAQQHAFQLPQIRLLHSFNTSVVSKTSGLDGCDQSSTSFCGIFKRNHSGAAALRGQCCYRIASPPNAFIMRSASSSADAVRRGRPWKAGDGCKLPTWLHMIIRKRE